MKNRISEIKRKTKETDISLKLNLDGKAKASIKTTIAFLDHMLELFARHGLFDLDIKAKGDTQVDEHHLVEDLGICLGQAIKESLHDKMGINRYGFASLPMDDSLVECSLDISGRPYLVFNMTNKKFTISDEKEKYELYEHFFHSLAQNAGITLHFNLRYGKNLHHNLEASFKAFAKSLQQATRISVAGAKVLPSTKGCI